MVLWFHGLGFDGLGFLTEVGLRHTGQFGIFRDQAGGWLKFAGAIFRLKATCLDGVFLKKMGGGGFEVP